MKIKNYCILITFFIFPLFANKIELIHNFAADVSDRQIFNLPAGWKEEDHTFYLLKQSLLKKNIEIYATDLKNCGSCEEIRYFVFWNIPNYIKKRALSAFPKEKMILFIWEPPTVEPHLYKKKYQKHFSKIYTWNDDLIDGKKFFKFYYPVLHPMVQDIPSFEKKKLCTLIIGTHRSNHPKQLYTERENVIKFFESKSTDDFELFGYGWESRNYRTYRGSVPDKLETLKHFRFSICYENMRDIKGYISEKIFDCFAAGCVPIYWGASNVEDYIPKNCFIDRRKFSNNEELYRFIKNMPKDTYGHYLENIENFLKSEQAQLFSRANFIKIFHEAIVIN